MSDQSSASAQPPCRNLRSKEMYYAYGQEDDDYSSGVFWCAKTQEGFGPDGQPARQTGLLQWPHLLYN